MSATATQIDGISSSEIYQRFQNLDNRLDDLSKKFQPVEPEELLTRKESASFLKINLSTLWGWTKKGFLKSYQLGGKVYYKRHEIEAKIVELKK